MTLRVALIMLVLCASASAQLILDNYTPTEIESIPSTGVVLQLHVENPTPNTVVFWDNTMIPTSKIDFADFEAVIPTFKIGYQGIYRLYVEDFLNPSDVSNDFLVVVGHVTNPKTCAGGLLPFETPPAEVNTYMATYDTTNCIFMEPPPGPIE